MGYGNEILSGSNEAEIKQLTTAMQEVATAVAVLTQKIKELKEENQALVQRQEMLCYDLRRAQYQILRLTKLLHANLSTACD